ncbi:hypothetical protein EDB84DRAFT_1433158 [Lactarius hengduanensis]|nr:hypothetical protein EDB84DRAFT_1433158 [Lactarius hengduanensis]
MSSYRWGRIVQAPSCGMPKWRRGGTGPGLGHTRLRRGRHGRSRGVKTSWWVEQTSGTSWEVYTREWRAFLGALVANARMVSRHEEIVNRRAICSSGACQQEGAVEEADLAAAALRSEETAETLASDSWVSLKLSGEMESSSRKLKEVVSPRDKIEKKRMRTVGVIPLVVASVSDGTRNLSIELADLSVVPMS